MREKPFNMTWNEIREYVKNFCLQIKKKLSRQFYKG